MVTDPDTLLNPIANTQISLSTFLTNVDAASLITFVLFLGLTLGGLIREINKQTGIPYTPMLFVFGLFVGLFSQNFGQLGTTIIMITNIDPHSILMIFLPILIFQSGFNADMHYFKQQSGQILVLAFPCVLISSFILMFALKLVLQFDDTFYTWPSAFMFGAILSCTDTVAVIALLKEVGAPKKFNSLIEGQSLINDGTCMVLFQIAAQLVAGVNMTAGEIIRLFFSLTVGGVALGLFFGIVACYCLKKVKNDELLTVNVTFIACYLTYFVAENVDMGFSISGIMALVALGLYMSVFGKTKIIPEIHHSVEIFWKYIVYVGQSTIFLLAGAVVGVKVLSAKDSSIDSFEYLRLIGLYFCMTFARFLSIAFFMPWIKKWGYGLAWKEVYVLTYGGIRGAIGISFALIVANDDTFSRKTRDIILFDMAGNALLTLIINGTTTGPLVRKLGLATVSTIRKKVYLNFLESLDSDLHDQYEQLKTNQYLQMGDWKEVPNLAGMNYYQQRIKKLSQKISDKEKQQKLMNNMVSRLPIEIEILQSKNDFVNQFMEVERKNRRKDTLERDEQENDQEENNHDYEEQRKNDNDDADENAEDDGGQENADQKKKKERKKSFDQYQVCQSNYEEMQEKRLNRKDKVSGEEDNQSEEDDDEGYDILGDDQMIIECRTRFLTALKGIYWDLFEQRQCSAGSVLTLTEAVNYDADNNTQQMNSWEFLKNTIHNSLYVKTLFRMRSLPIIGNIASNSLLNHISHLYDILSTYITAHTEVEDLAQVDFPLKERVIQKILKQSNDNKNFAQQYIDGYLKISFPEIIDEIKLQKAAFVILTNQMSVLNQTKKHGLLDENAHKMLKEKVEYYTDELEELTPTWETQAEAINNNIQNIQFFKYVPEHILTKLVNETEEMIFQRESYIYKEGERATYIFLIIRGTATETTSQGQIALHYKRKVGSMVSEIHLFNSVSRYQTSCIADAVVYVKAFKITTLRAIIDMSSKIEELVWIDSLHVLSKIHSKGLQMIADLPPQTYSKLQPYIRLMQYQKDQLINLDNGGVLVEGVITRDVRSHSLQGKKEDELDEESKSPLKHNSVVDQSNTNQKSSLGAGGQKSSTGEGQDNNIASAYLLILKASGNSFRAVKKTQILHFENSEQIMEIISHITLAELENQNRLSSAGLERKSQRNYTVKGSYLARFSVNETFGRISQKRDSKFQHRPDAAQKNSNN